MIALSLQRREAINSRSKHSLESNHEKGTKTSYTDGFVPLYTSKKSYYAFSQTDFYHKTNPNLFFRKGSDQKFLVEHRRFELLTSTMRMSRANGVFLRAPQAAFSQMRLTWPFDGFVAQLRLSSQQIALYLLSPGMILPLRRR